MPLVLHGSYGLTDNDSANSNKYLPFYKRPPHLAGAAVFVIWAWILALFKNMYCVNIPFNVAGVSASFSVS